MKQKHFIVYVILLATLFGLPAVNIFSQERTELSSNLPIKYEELRAPDFTNAVDKSGSTCLIPIGVLEKHGPHLPLGTDMLDVREVALSVAKKGYTIVFPEYYFSQILEAKHQPGTIAYSPQLIWSILQETCDELARNGIKKIILVNGHGGNNSFLAYFCQAQLDKRKDYFVVLFRPESGPEVAEKVKKLRKTTTGGHAGEMETSMMLVSRPDLVHMDSAKEQSGEDLRRLKHLPYTYTGIWWYAQYPNHYAGDGSYASREIGELLIDSQVDQLVELIKILKTDDSILELQDRFFNETEKPLETKQ